MTNEQDDTLDADSQKTYSQVEDTDVTSKIEQAIRQAGRGEQPAKPPQK